MTTIRDLPDETLSALKRRCDSDRARIMPLLGITPDEKSIWNRAFSAGVSAGLEFHPRPSIGPIDPQKETEVARRGDLEPQSAHFNAIGSDQCKIGLEEKR